MVPLTIRRSLRGTSARNTAMPAGLFYVCSCERVPCGHLRVTGRYALTQQAQRTRTVGTCYSDVALHMRLADRRCSRRGLAGVL